MSGCILVVDDSLTVRMNLMDVLTAAELPAVACASLAEARAALARERFCARHPRRVAARWGRHPAARGAAGDAVGERYRGHAAVDRSRDPRPHSRPDHRCGRICRQTLRSGLRRRARARAAGAPRRRRPATDSSETVLVIDDSVTFREALKGELENAGYRVLVAGQRRGRLAPGRRSAPDRHHRRRRAARHRRGDGHSPHPARRGAARPSLPAADRLGRARRGGSRTRCRRRCLRPQGGQCCRHPRPAERHAAERRWAESPSTARRACSDPRRSSPWTTAKPICRSWPRRCARTATRRCSPAPARRRWRCSSASRSIVFCSTSSCRASAARKPAGASRACRSRATFRS